MTAREIIQLIATQTSPSAQTCVPIVEAPCPCGGMYLINKRVVILADAEATDGESLAIATHEAFHVKRHQEGVAFYRNVPKLPCRRLFEEEQIVNDLAEAFLSQIPMAPEEWAAALRFFRASRHSYTWMGQGKSALIAFRESGRFLGKVYRGRKAGTLTTESMAALSVEFAVRMKDAILEM